MPCAARRSLEIAEQASDVRLRALAHHRVGLGLYSVGDYAGSAVALRQTCDLLSGSLRFERIGMAAITTVIAGGFLVASLSALGEIEEADRRLARRWPRRPIAGYLFDRLGPAHALHPGTGAIRRDHGRAAAGRPAARRQGRRCARHRASHQVFLDGRNSLPATRRRRCSC